MLTVQKYFFLLGFLSLKTEEIRAYEAVDDYENKHQDYMFSYGVQDLHTGDVKSQWEKKIGDVVHGYYTVLEADGSMRIVHYTADEKNGFQAVVKHQEPHHSLKAVSTNSEHELDTTDRLRSTLDTSKETPEIDSYLFIPASDQFAYENDAQENRQHQEVFGRQHADEHKVSFTETGHSNTFDTKKKPLTTPGLKDFSNERKLQLRSTMQFPRQKDANKKRYFSYTKRISYFPYDS